MIIDIASLIYEAIACILTDRKLALMLRLAEGNGGAQLVKLLRQMDLAVLTSLCKATDVSMPAQYSHRATCGMTLLEGHRIGTLFPKT
jgi:hypothetical protein